MIMRLDNAIGALNPGYQHKTDVAGFKSHLRVTRDMFGWKIQQLSLFQRLYYCLFSFFGASLEKENKKTLQNNIVYLQAEAIQNNGKLGEKAKALVDLFGINILRNKQIEQRPPSLPPSQSPIKKQHGLQEFLLMGSCRPTVQTDRQDVTSVPIFEPAREGRLFVPNCPVRGIDNPGNSCWINSCCQVLFQIETFVEALNQHPTQLENETKEIFEKREKAFTALKTLYDVYIHPNSTPSSRSAALEKMKLALYAYSPTYFSKPDPHAQHDSAEGTAALFNLVGVDAHAFGLKGTLPIAQQITNLLTQDNLWVRMVNRLRLIIDPDEVRVRELNSEAYNAFQKAWIEIKPDLHRASSEQFEGETEEEFAARKGVVEALKNFQREVKRQNGLKSANVENEEFCIDRLKPLVQQIEFALSRFRPDLQAESIKTTLIDAFLPPAARERIFTKQLQLAREILERDPTSFEVNDFSLMYDLNYQEDGTPTNTPPILYLTRQSLVTQGAGDHFSAVVVHRGTEAERGIPTELDLSTFTIEEIRAKYRLVGMAHHLGQSSRGGHYVATLNLRGKAFAANDSHVSEIGTTFECDHGVAIYELVKDQE